MWVQKRKGGKEVVRQAIEALQELMLTVLLPDRRLKFLEQQDVQVCVRGEKGVGNGEMQRERGMAAARAEAKVSGAAGRAGGWAETL